MSSFEVQLPVLRQGATDMSALATRVTWAMYHAKAHVSSSIEGGTWFFDAGAEINDLGDYLGEQYSHTNVRALFDSASIALQQMARDYAEVDVGVARTADAMSTQLGDVTPDRDIYSGLNGREAGVDSPSYEDAFEDPESAYADWDSFWEIGDKITYITSFEWIGSPLEKFNLPNPVKELMGKFDGDWPRLGRAIGAVDQLSSYWYSIASDVTSVRNSLDAGWSGVAADATLDWFDTLHDACSDHAQSLGDFETRVRTEALAMKSAVDLVAGLIEDIAGVIPDLEGGAVDKILGILESAVKGLGKLIDIIDKAILALEAATTVAMSLLTVFAQLSSGDGEFPSVSEPVALDVNG